MKKIFLLATGFTINDITEKQWDYIKSHDTMGISWFFKKDFETKYYYVHEYDMQPISVSKKIYESNWKTKVFFGTKEYIGKSYNEIQSSKLAFNSFKDKINCEEVNFSHWLYSWKGKTWSVNENNPPLSFDSTWAKTKKDILFGFRGTMVSSINLCTVLGYDEIILCGVDLNNGIHFYDDPKKHEINKVFGTDSINDKHSTCIEYKGVRPVIDGLKWINDNISLKIISKKSLLYENGFELYEF